MKHFCLMCFLLAISICMALEIVHHDIQMRITPLESQIYVEDTITCVGKGNLEFVLNGELSLSLLSPHWKLENMGEIKTEHFGINASLPLQDRSVTVRRYRLVPGSDGNGDRVLIRLAYHGKIFYPVETTQEEYSRSFQETAGIICPQGIYLSGSTFWYPQIHETCTSFRLEVSVPPDWYVISQGQEVSCSQEASYRRSTWECSVPMEEIYLAGGPLTRYQDKAGEVQTLVYLRQPDEELAVRYLKATGEYLAKYTALIGEYPYPKFALVENFWEIGYGMPSFTLLGSKIIRFPFILRSSYPHEILHNWWGNGVLVDYPKGNWCEGLTAYMADHLSKEEQGEAHEYRRDILQKYRNFVRDHEDFPLSEFRARHSGASEAIGYGKSLMLWHELRMKLGNEVFLRSLREFYRTFRFRKASFVDLQETFGRVSGKDLRTFFHERVSLKGAVQMGIADAKREMLHDKYLLHFTLSQKNDGNCRELQVPVAITMENCQEALWLTVPLEHSIVSISLNLAHKPVRIDVDPQFDVFRKVDRSEISPSIGQIFGSGKLCLVIPASSSLEWQKEYQNMARVWSAQQNLPILKDSELTSMPQDTSIWFCGLQNRFGPELQKWFSFYGAHIDTRGVEIDGKHFSTQEHAIVLTAAHPVHEEMAIGWIFGATSPTLSLLARKLPHYGKYGYLIFRDRTAENSGKGQWPVINSTMTVSLGEKNVCMANISRRIALSRTLGLDRDRLVSHMKFLASPELRGRGLATAELDTAADYIAEQFQKAKLKPAGDSDSYLQTWEIVTGLNSQPVRLKNVAGLLMGTDTTLTQAPLIIGAHYDHLGLGWPDVKKDNRGKVHPGADDNASGVAILLELVHLFTHQPGCLRPILFIAFTGEEAGCLGSSYFVDKLSVDKRAAILAMINLDTVGRLGNNNLMALGTNSAQEWPYLIQTCSSSELRVVAVMQTMESSDHKSFIAKNIPAIQIFSGAHGDYHTPEDTLDKIDVEGMTKIGAFLHQLIYGLANRKQPLTPILASKESNGKISPIKKRVQLGSLPNFNYQGKGVLLAGVTAGSPAQKAGLAKDDIIVKLGEFPIDNLSSLAQALRSYSPGTKVFIEYIRQGQLHKTEAILEER